MKPLLQAAKEGDLRAVEESLASRKGASVDEEDELLLTPLIWAAHGGHLEIVKLLLERGAKIDKRSKNGSTAIHQAAFRGHFLVVHFLLKKGANPFIETDHTTDPPNVTPLEWAIYSPDSNPRTRSMLKEAMEHFDEQEQRVFRRYLQQHGLQQYEKIFLDHGLKMSNLKRVSDIDLRKMDITSDQERRRILAAFRRKKRPQFNHPWFTAEQADPRLLPLQQRTTPRKIAPVANFSEDALEDVVRRSLLSGLKAVEGVFSGAAVIPAVGLYRIQEHVFRSVPKLVKGKQELAETADKVVGATTDLEYSHRELSHISVTGTFAQIQSLLLKATDLASSMRPRTGPGSRKGSVLSGRSITASFSSQFSSASDGKT